MGDVLSGEFNNTAKCEQVHLTGKMQIWAKPKPLYKQKEQTRKTKYLVCLLFLFVLV